MPIAGIYRAIVEKEFKRLVISVCVALPFAIAVNWPIASKIKMEAPTHFNIGYELEKRGELNAAKNSYLKSVELIAENSLALNNLGMVAIKQNQPDEAIRYFREAVKAQPNNWDARINLGIVLWERGQKAEAIEQYEYVARKEPGYNPALCYNIACYYASLGHTIKGMAWLREAIENGYENWELIQKDPDLDTLRDLPEFKRLRKP